MSPERLQKSEPRKEFQMRNLERGSLNSMLLTFQRLLGKKTLLKEVHSYPDGRTVNWSDLARKYNITNKKGKVASNGGQIAQDIVINNGENIHHFGYETKENYRTRNIM